MQAEWWKWRNNYTAMTKQEERELLRLTKANNKMLKEVIRYINFINSRSEEENNYDFLRNVIANLISNGVGRFAK